MKRIFTAAIVILVLVAVALVAAKTDIGCEACGTWKAEEAGYYEEITLNSDGTCLIQEGDESGTLSAKGKWSQTGDEITLSYWGVNSYYRLSKEGLYGPINERFTPSKTYKK